MIRVSTGLMVPLWAGCMTCFVSCLPCARNAVLRLGAVAVVRSLRRRRRFAPRHSIPAQTHSQAQGMGPHLGLWAGPGGSGVLGPGHGASPSLQGPMRNSLRTCSRDIHEAYSQAASNQALTRDFVVSDSPLNKPPRVASRREGWALTIWRGRNARPIRC